MPRKRGKRLKGQPKCKACGCEEILLVENKHAGCFVVRCHDNPWPAGHAAKAIATAVRDFEAQHKKCWAI